MYLLSFCDSAIYPLYVSVSLLNYFLLLGSFLQVLANIVSVIMNSLVINLCTQS